MVKLLTCNIRSLNNAKNFYKIQSLLSKDKCILLMQETWHPKSTSDIKNYQLHLQVRNKDISNKKTGGGIGHYFHTSLKCSTINLNLNLKDTWEIYAFTYENYIIVNVYRPPDGPTNEKTWSHLYNVIENLMSTYTKHFILLCGDLNIDLKQQNSICSKLNNTMDSLGLTQIVTEPTHYGNHKNSLIDHVWTNELNSTTTIVDLDISDHLAIEINLPTNTTLDSNCTIRNTSEENVQKAMQLIDDESESLSTCSILNFLNSLINILDKTCPLITVQQNKNDGIKFIPDSKYKELKKKCRNLINKMSHSPSAHLKTEYKRKRKEKNIHADKLLKDEAKKQIELCNGDQAKLWKILNSKSGNLKCSTENKLEIKRLDNTKTSNTEEICNIFADFFEEIPTKTVNEINNREPIFDHIEFNHNCFTNFNELNEDRLASILSSIDSKSSTGVDGISMKLLKKLMPSLKTPLLTHLNHMIRQKKVDPILKLAKTIPLLKKGDKSLPVNYRPISLLIAILKILEKSMNIDIIDHVDKTLDNRQFGFRKLKGTIDALTDIIDDVTPSKNQGLEVASACIDISKAFDTLNHGILLKKTVPNWVRR